MSPAGELRDARSHDGPFAIKDCALIAIATGKRALTLKELHDVLSEIDLGSVYYHMWGGLLEPRFEEREFNNDFAAWARHGLHDGVLTERLALVDPTDAGGLEELRQELMEIIEERLDESEYLPWARATQPFEFVRSQIVVFDTRRRAHRVEELAQLMPQLSPSAIFYHFIDARRRLPESCSDFSLWLASFGGEYEDLRQRLAGIDPYFRSLTELREEIATIFGAYFEERR
ncbi:MAG: DUF5752 family protein [Nitrospirota bacterium]|jgi:hypothetical protein